MPIPEAFFRWPALDSSGASTTVYGDNGDLRGCRNITITIEKGAAADTAVVGIEHARTSTSPFVRMGSTAYLLDSSAVGQSVTAQFTGPLFTIRPYVISKTASTTIVTVALIGN